MGIDTVLANDYLRVRGTTEDLLERKHYEL